MPEVVNVQRCIAGDLLQSIDDATANLLDPGMSSSAGKFWKKIRRRRS
jgi:hypothetical protein